MANKKRVIALGFFDGIHIGHSALLRRVLEIASEENLTPSVITFDTHPLCLVGDAPISLINSPEDRSGLIRRIFGIDDIIFLRFDRLMADMPWNDFIDYLPDEFGARYLVAGYNFRFGKGGKGDGKLLLSKCEELSIGCEIIPEVKCNGIACNSTYIRELLLEGDVEMSTAFLGHPHVLTDVVGYGYRLGSTLGLPTINMRFEENVLIPAFGVYATKVYLEDGSEHSGVTNIGIRPTVDNSGKVTAETHILNYKGNLYGHKVRIAFYKRLRPEMKFANINELKAQIEADCKAVGDYFFE